MAITNRIKRLFRADVNAILDVIEEPEAVLKQAIREMQETLDRERGLLASNQKHLETMRQNESFLREQLVKIQSDLDLCLSEGPEELVRKTIARRLSCEKHLKLVQRKISSLEQQVKEKASDIEHRQDQLDSIMEKAELYVQTHTEDSPFSIADSILSSTEAGISMGNVQVTDEEIEMEWMRLREKGGQS
jgi:phage shock protein A